MTARIPTLAHELSLHAEGFARIAGVDEAGRGAWAGPVFAAAVILPHDARALAALRGVRDSKTLSERQRNIARVAIEQISLARGVGAASAEEIDALGILPATRLAMARAVALLSPQPDALIVDAVKLPAVPIHQRTFNFADSISLSVAAASILAKTERDAFMRAMSVVHAAYGLERHKGYGTRAHAAALAAHGPCDIHRRSFAPVRRIALEKDRLTEPRARA